MIEPQDSVKPLAYLDHNILDLFTEPKCLLGKDSDLFKLLKNEVQVVYSPITLEEIYRSIVNGKSNTYGLAFLNVLKELDAQFITLINENGKTINTIFRSWEEPLVHFNYYVENNYLDKFIKPLKNNLFAIYGGIKDYKKFETEQLENFENILIFIESLLNYLQIFENKDEYICAEIKKYKEELPKLRAEKLKYESHIKLSIQHLEESNRTQAANKNFRESLKINHDKLQKIEFPNVLNQIWEMLQKNNPQLENLELDKFFQLQKDINSKKEYYIFEKVNQIYTMLNMIGYYQDEGLHKEKRFIASFSDMSHASYGCFCEYLFTRDKAFSKKTAVAYEYLNIATQIFTIDIN